MTSQPVLDESNSKLYVSRGVPKKAVIKWQAAKYELEWGAQSFDGPHMLIDDRYGSDLEAFFTTHEPIKDREHHYIKVAKVRAMKVDKDTDLTTLIRGNVEMQSKVKAGGWIIQNPSGELYYNTAEEFAKRYEPADGE